MLGANVWRRVLDLGTLQCFLQADSPRVNCPTRGPTVAQVPWARHGAGHTKDFDDQVAWLVTHTPKSAVCALMRIAVNGHQKVPVGGHGGCTARGHACTSRAAIKSP